MLNKLKTWKDSLIDKVTNVSLKNVKVSKTSFRVSSFILSLVLVCTLTILLFITKSISSNAAINTALRDSALYYEDLGNDNYRFYFSDDITGEVKDNNGNVLSDFTFTHGTYNQNSSYGDYYYFSNSVSPEDDNILILQGTFNLITNQSLLTYTNSDITYNVNKIAASKLGVTLKNDASYLFTNLSNLIEFDGRNFDTSNVTGMSYFLSNNAKLVKANLSSFDLSKTVNMDYMFYLDSNLTDLNLNFTSSNSYNGSFGSRKMSYMFGYCGSLYDLDLSKLDTKNVTNMDNMFEACGNLVNLNLSGFNTQSLSHADHMFNYCVNLSSIDLSSFELSNSLTTMLNSDSFKPYKIILPKRVLDSISLPNAGSNYKYALCDINGDIIPGYENPTDLGYYMNINSYMNDGDGIFEAGEPYQLLKVPTDYNNEFYSYKDSSKIIRFYHDKVLNTKNGNTDITDQFYIYKVSFINKYQKNDSSLADPQETDYDNKKLELANNKNTIGAYFYIPKDTTDTGIYKDCGTMILNGMISDDIDTTLNIKSSVNSTYYYQLEFVNSCGIYKLDDALTPGTYSYRKIDETIDTEFYREDNHELYKYNDLTPLVNYIYISNRGFKVPTFFSIFQNAQNVTNLDLSSRLDFSIFSGSACYMCVDMKKLQTINVNALNNRLNGVELMFENCKELTTISHADSLVTSYCNSISHIFRGCNKLSSVNYKDWDVSNVVKADYAFDGMKSMDEFDFTKWNCKLTNVVGMFSNVFCDKPIKFGNMNFDNIQDLYCFYEYSAIAVEDYTIFKNSDIRGSAFTNYTTTLKRTPVVNFEGVSFENVNQKPAWLGTFSDTDEVILPAKVPVLTKYDIYAEAGKIWQGFDIDDNPLNYYICDNVLPAAYSDSENKLYKIKQVPATPIYTKGSTNYYRNGYANRNSLLTYRDEAVIDIGFAFDISKAQDRSIMCYIYDDGTMIFDGEGPIKGAGDGYTNNEYIPWRMTYKDIYGNDFIPIDNVTKIIGSNAGFKPEGSLAYYFSPITKQNTGLKNHIKTVDVTNFDTSKVNCFDFTFSGINNVDGIEFINIDKLNTSAALSMKSMFEGVNCASLDLHATIDNTDPLNVKKYWDVSKVHYFGNMFCSATIDTVNLDNWNLDSTYTDPNGINFSGPYGFVYGAHIKNLSLNNWNNTGKANPAKFLAYVWELNSVDLSSFNFEINQESISFLYHRYSINEIILPNTLSADKINVLSDWDVQQSYGFYGCNKDGEVVTTMPYKYLIGKVDSNGDGDFLDKTDIYMFKLISDTLYTDSDTGVSYYRGGTSKSDATDDTKVTLVKEFDITDTSGPNNTPAGSVKAYLYSDGLLIFDGIGDIKMSRDYNDSSDTTTEELEFLSNDTYRNQVTKVVGSIRGFKPSGYLRYLCYNMDNLVEFDGTNFDLTNVTSLMSMFDNKTSDGLSKLETVNFKNTNPNKNTNSVTTCNGMFNECSSLTSVDFSGCTFNSLKDTSYMFNNCSNLTSIDLSSLNCELTDVSGMFGGATGLTTLTLGDDTNGYNISLNTDNISCMFTNTGLSKIDFSKFKESKQAIKKLEGAAGFSTNCTLIDLSSLDLSLATLANTEDNNVKRRLFYCASWDYDDFKDTNIIETIILPSNVPTGTDALYLPHADGYVWQGYESDGTTKVGGTFTTLPKAGHVTDLNMIKLVRAALYVDDTDSSNIIEYYSNGTNIPGLTLAKYDSDNNGTDDKDCIWNLSTDGKLKAYLYTDGTLILDGEGTLKDFTKGYDKQILPWREYKKLESLHRVVGSINGFTPTGSMADFFSFGFDENGYYSSFVSVPDQNLTSIDFTNIDTKNVDSFKRLFYYAKKLDTLTNIENINTSNVTNMMSAFSLIEKINNLDLSEWDVSNVTIFNYMFNYYGYYSSNNTTFNLSNWVLNNETDKDVTMVGMFEDAYINTIDMSGWTNTDNISKTKEMFKQSKFIIGNNLDLSSIDFTNTNLTNSANTSDMFTGSTLRDIILPNSMLDGVDISLPSFSDKVWMGYNNDTSVGTNSYTKLMAKTNTSDGLINRLKASYPTLFTIDNISYSGSDKVAEWDISKKNNGSIKAYLFKDPTDSDDLTLVFDQTSDKFGDGDNDYNVVKYYDNFNYNGTRTPWYTYLTDSNNSSKHINRIKFNSDINFEQLKYFFSYMPDLKEIDLSHFVCTKASTNGYEFTELFNSLDVTVKMNYKFKDPSVKRYISYGIFNDTSYLYPDDNSKEILPEENNITIDFSGLIIDNLHDSLNGYSDLASHIYVNKIIVPEKINGYTKDLALFSIAAMPTMYEAYNDNGTKLDESDDEFLGYTIYLTDNNHAFDGFGKSVSYLKSRVDLAPYAILEVYKDGDIEFKTTFADTYKEAIYKCFNYYLYILINYIDYNRTLPSVHNYEFLYDGTGTDPFNTFNGVIDKRLFYEYIYNGNTIEFVTDMYEYMKVKQEENSISDTDFDTLKLYMNEYIHDLFNVATNDIGVLNYLDNLKITITNGITNILDDLFELYEVKDGEAIAKTYETSDTLTLLLNKEWDDLSSDMQTFFGSKDDFDEFIDFWLGDMTFDEVIAFITGDASDSFIETDSYYVFKISDDFSNGAYLPFFYYLSNKESSNIKFYTLGDSMIYGSFANPYGLYTAAKSSAGFNINSITSDSDVENMFASNIVDTSFEDNKGYFIIELDDSFNNYLAVPKEALACNIELNNEFDILLDKIGNLLYEVRPHSISDLGQLIENEIPDNIPDGYAFNYKRLNVTVNALDISSSNTRVYAGDISSKVFDVNPITCDSEVHLYYKNNEWQDGDDPIELVQDVDYQITGYSDNDKQGTATIHLQGISPNVTGTRDITFNIVNAIKKLDINNLTLSDSEKAGAIINKDGTDRVLDAISFNDANSNTLHPYILDSDGITPIYLSYTKAYVSDSAGDPKFIARAKDTSDSLAISNITFEGLKLVDQSGAYELYEDDTHTKLVSANNSNDTFILSDSSYLIDNTSPVIDKIIINNSKNTKLKENDTVNVSITFSEELDFNLLDTDSFVNTYKDNIYLSYKIGSNTFDNYKLNLSSLESPRALSDTNRKTIMKFSGKIPNDLGELIDAPFTLYDIKLDGITSDEVRDASINELDVSNFSVKVNVPELTGYLVNTKVDEPDPVKPTPEKPITTQTITVQVVKNNSYIDGYKDGTFKPNKNITRGEFSKILALISNNYSDSNKLDYSRYINSYSDVSNTDWYSSYVGFNNKKQVMVGYSDGTFRPNKAITRAEVSKALTNMFDINNNVNNANIFNNELNGKWYENSMKKLIKAGLLKGYPDGLLRPNDPITRAEVVALINRITNRELTNKNVDLSKLNIFDVTKDKWYYNDIASAMLDY